LVELAHQASFASGLANSLYAPRFNTGLDGDALQDFRRRTFTANRLTLVGVGIRHDDLLRHAEFFRLPGPAADFSRDKSRFLPCKLSLFFFFLIYRSIEFICLNGYK
jgi:hypothetical protein